MKRVNKKTYFRLKRLSAEIADAIDTGKQSLTIHRGDMRAIQWARWWIQERLDDDARKGPR